ncbi:DUF1016 domain-containing protein [Marinifilum sp. JC120]|nr:DUF1016 domain-containing protein [Marinifilum sp. JC120]
MKSSLVSAEYKQWLRELKDRLRQSQLKAAVQVNTTLLEFYWELGAEIVEKQKHATWGSGFLKQLSHDLMNEFPDIKGFSYRNLRYIRGWVLFYIDDDHNLATACCQIGEAYSPIFHIPWGHNLVLISKCAEINEALYYARMTVEHSWSRNVLLHQIENGLFRREGKAITNFAASLPTSQSDLAHQMIKDPYTFDFLTLGVDHNERELEMGLIEHITKFLLELGAGFAYIGRQRQLQVGERDFFIDLLFYHTKLHCYVVIELKTGDFEPEYAGKLNFYIKAVDEQIRTERDEPTIGILLCKSKDKVVVEYALSDIYKPIGVSEYELGLSLPEDFKSSLPSIEQLELELTGLLDEEG